MNEDRLKELAHWRDAQLFKRYGDEGASIRLRGIDLKAALAIRPPSPEELGWTSLDGSPIDPDHHWWDGARR